MSDDIHAEANTQQGTPGINDLEVRLKADEASRSTDPDVDTPDPDPEAADPEADPEAKDKAEPEPEPDDDLKKRNARLFHEKRQAERAAKQLQAQLDRLQGNAPPLSQDEETEQRIVAKAAQLAQENEYNKRANQIYADGVKDFPDFETKLAGFRELGGVNQVLVEAADELGDAHKIIHYLSDNLDEAERLLSMKPHQMGVALAKISTKLNAEPPPRPQSKAPAPIKPVQSRGTTDQTDMMKMSIEQFMKAEDTKYGRVKR